MHLLDLRPRNAITEIREHDIAGHALKLRVLDALEELIGDYAVRVGEVLEVYAGRERRHRAVEGESERPKRIGRRRKCSLGR